MADPFEVRMRFTTLLTHLSASTTAQLKAAHYALKHRDMDEDLHSCILENLERGHNMNNRANIMYFLEQHADMNLREGGHEPYVEMIRRDIERIVEAVAQSGANVKVVRKVLNGLGEKGVLASDMIGPIETGLKEREDKVGHLFGDDEKDEPPRDREMADIVVEGLDGAHPTTRVTSKAEQSQQQNQPPREQQGQQQQQQQQQKEQLKQQQQEQHRHGGAKSNGVSKIDKRAIEQRIEEDRERNKRLRESVWAVSGEDDQELDKMWEEGSELGEDDYVIADEEAEERKQFARYHRALLEA